MQRVRTDQSVNATPEVLPLRPSLREGGANDIVCVVFSKDRPLQLDATLRSLKHNCTDLGVASIHVLYASSSAKSDAQYRVLAADHPDILLVREARFKSDLVGLLQGATHVMFLVDDTLFVGPLSLAHAIEVLDSTPACFGFSFRLGKNTAYCYTLDRSQRLPDFKELGPSLLLFNWTSAEFDFGYPIEVASSLYRASEVLPLLATLDYGNPNTLEGGLANEAARFRTSRPLLACYPQSVAFSVPANLVQAVSDNRVGGREELSASALLDRHAHGDRLDTDRYQGMVPTASHQEIDFVYRRDPEYPTVSVIIPCYEQGQYLREAVESVVSQSFGAWECIIVDDGSPDDTQGIARELIRQHPDRRISLLSQPNSGLSSARNAGIRVARGRYILPLDADDMIGTSMLEACVDLLESRPDIAIAYGEQQQRFGEETGLHRLSPFDPFMLPYRNSLSYSSMYRSEVWDAVGGYSANMNGGYEDWDFWVGAVEHGYTAAAAPGATTFYRIRPGSMAQEASRRDRELRRRMRHNHPSMYTPWKRLARSIVAFSTSRPVIAVRSALGPVRRRLFPRR